MTSRRALREAAGHAGFTLVEVLVSLAVLAIGVTGILSLEQSSVQSNRAAQEMTVATGIARRWQERLSDDALQWNSPSSRNPNSDLARDTAYLCNVIGCASGSTSASTGWFVPVPPTGSTDSAAFDAFGNEVVVSSSAVHYCTNVRLTWLRAESPGTPGVLRAEVRVWWYREGASRNAAYANCGSSAGLNMLGTDIANVQYVQAAQALTGHPL
jgi:prepilin-type N-terminal cleavage/methylation domain-containing protein